MDLESEIPLDRHPVIDTIKSGENNRIHIVQDKVINEIKVMKKLGRSANIGLLRKLRKEPVKNTPAIFEVFAYNEHIYMIEEYIHT